MHKEITIKIDKRSKQAKVFYEYLKTLPFVELEEPLYNGDTEKAIKWLNRAKRLKTLLKILEKNFTLNVSA